MLQALLGRLQGHWAGRNDLGRLRGPGRGPAAAPEARAEGLAKVQGEIMKQEAFCHYPPVNGTRGFASKCVWTHVDTGRRWVNIGTWEKSQWQEVGVDERQPKQEELFQC